MASSKIIVGDVKETQRHNDGRFRRFIRISFNNYNSLKDEERCEAIDAAIMEASKRLNKDIPKIGHYQYNLKGGFNMQYENDTFTRHDNHDFLSATIKTCTSNYKNFCTKNDLKIEMISFNVQKSIVEKEESEEAGRRMFEFIAQRIRESNRRQ